jgi:hypothetical protein
MPEITIRNVHDMPTPTRTTSVVREVQLQFEGYLQAIGSDVGELELSPMEQLRGVKVRLRRAASGLGEEIDIWDAEGGVYFRMATKHGRPRKTN